MGKTRKKCTEEREEENGSGRFFCEMGKDKHDKFEWKSPKNKNTDMEKK